MARRSQATGMRDGHLRGALSPQPTQHQMDVLAAYVSAGASRGRSSTERMLSLIAASHAQGWELTARRSREPAVVIVWSPRGGWVPGISSTAEDVSLSTFVIVPGAWGSPAEMEPLVEPLESAGHEVIIVDLPCDDAAATLEQYAAAVRAVLPDDAADVVLVGHSFGGFTVSTIAAENVGMSVVYVAAWIPQPGASVLDLFMGSDPFADADEDAGIAAFGGLIVSAGPGRCALNIDPYVAAADPAERDAVRSYLERTQRPQGIAALRQKWHGDLATSGRRTYILTTADTVVPPELQRAMAASVDAEIVEIATGHGPFREQPQRLAELLVAATR